MKKYEAYKEISHFIFDKIPNKWSISKLKYLLSDNPFRSGPFGSALITSQLKELGNVLVYTPEHIAGKNIKHQAFIPPEREEELSKYLIYDGDIVLPIVGTLGRAKLFDSDDRPGILNQRLCKITPDEDKIKGEYLLLILKEVPYIKTQLELEKKGAILDHITKDVIFNFTIPLPSIATQDKILIYLDHKTQIIDALIDKKEQLIKKLQAQRQAIINEAVTKGLNKNVPLKDSGIEWLGKINTQWVIKRIKHTTYVKGRIGWQGLRSEDFREVGPYLVTGTDFVKGRIKWETCHRVDEDRYDIDPKIQLKEDDVLITKDGTIGKIAIVKGKPQKVTLNTGVFVTRPIKDDYLQDYFYWLLTSEVFTHFIDFNKSGATIQHLYQNVFNEFSFALPVNLKEQKEIIDYLDEKTRKMDLLLEKVKNQIKKLKSFRQSIISEAVTGKIDVRDWQPPKNNN